MKKLFVLGIALFFCLFFVGCSWVTVPLFFPDNGGMDKYGIIDVSVMISSVVSPLDSIETCVYLYTESLGYPSKL